MVRHLLAVLALVAVTAVSCGGDSATLSTYTSDAFGFSMDVPDNFRVIDLETDDLPALLSDTDLSQNAQLLIANTLSNVGSGFLLWAFDFDAGNEAFIPNLNVVRQPRLQGETVDSVRDTLAQGYSGVAGAEVLSIDELDIATGTSLLVEALFPINGVEDDSHSIQLITFTEQYSYTITYSYIEPSDAERQLAVDSFESFTASE